MTVPGRDEIPELKPCPFCGSEARWATCEGGDDSWEIQCSNNDCCIVLFAGATARETVASWNTRADSALTRENRSLIDALGSKDAEITCHYAVDEAGERGFSLRRNGKQFRWFTWSEVMAQNKRAVP